jgi:5-formyltetrahydrofolate cyclo-ligase
MAAHPGTLVIGMAWHCTLAAFDAGPHDQAPAIILTEQGIWEA